MDLDVFIELNRPFEFHERANGVEIFTDPIDLAHVVIGERTEIFRNCGVEIRQVVRIEYDLLAVHFRVTDAEWPGKTEVGPRQRSTLLARVDDPGHAKHNLILLDIQKTRF